MKNALIGYTGFLGQNLMEQMQFAEVYNSKNIERIRGKTFDRIIIAAPSAEKWKVNESLQAKKDDLKNILKLVDILDTVTGTKVLLSTVDVYPIPNKVNEESPIPFNYENGYGTNRLLLETLLKPQHIIRLPAMFGPHLKKNAIYDLAHCKNLEKLDINSEYQFFNVKHLKYIIETSINRGLHLKNIATSPISLKNIIEATGISTANFKASNQAPLYDVHTSRAVYQNIDPTMDELVGFIKAQWNKNGRR